MRSEPAHSPLSARPSDSEDVQRAFVEYTLREALGAVIAADTHDMVIALALERSGRKSLPAGAHEVEGFIAGSFHEAVEEAFGLNVADAAVEEVRGILPSAFDPTDRNEPVTMRVEDPALWDDDPLGIFEQSTRPMEATPPMDHSTSRFTTIPAAACNERVLFVSTRHDAVYEAVVVGLEPETAVVRTRGIDELLNALDADGPEPLVMVDAREETESPGLNQLAQLLPPDARVLLWGDGAALKNTIPLLVLRPEWVLCNPEAEPEDVSAIVSILLGR